MSTIPAYPTATTPLAGDEIFPLWQNGHQKQAPVDALLSRYSTQIAAINAASDAGVAAIVAAAEAELATVTEIVDATIGDPNPGTGSTGGSGYFAVDDPVVADGDAHTVIVSSIGARTVNLARARHTGGNIVKVVGSEFTVAGDGTPGQRIAVTGQTFQAGDLIVGKANEIQTIASVTPSTFYLGGSLPDTIAAAPNVNHLLLGVVIGVVTSIDIAARFAEVQATQEYSISYVGAHGPVAQSTGSTPPSAHLTVSAAVPVTGIASGLVIDAHSTGTAALQRKVAGVLTGPVQLVPVSATGPQIIPMALAITAGDLIDMSGISVGFQDPAAAGGVTCTQFGGTLGFALGYQVRTPLDLTPVARKLAATPLGTRTNEITVWGNSLGAYVQDPANSFPSWLAAYSGCIVHNRSVSGDKSSDILTRFLAEPARWGDINIFDNWGRNNFGDVGGPDLIMANLETALDKLTPQWGMRALITANWASVDEYAGGSAAANRPIIDALNERIKVRWPHIVLDMYRHLVISGIAESGVAAGGTEQATALARGTIPPSMLIDSLHGNGYAYRPEAKMTYDDIRHRGWVSQY